MTDLLFGIGATFVVLSLVVAACLTVADHHIKSLFNWTDRHD